MDITQIQREIKGIAHEQRANSNCLNKFSQKRTIRLTLYWWCSSIDFAVSCGFSSCCGGSELRKLRFCESFRFWTLRVSWEIFKKKWISILESSKPLYNVDITVLMPFNISSFEEMRSETELEGKWEINEKAIVYVESHRNNTNLQD